MFNGSSYNDVIHLHKIVNRKETRVNSKRNLIHQFAIKEMIMLYLGSRYK